MGRQVAILTLARTTAGSRMVCELPVTMSEHLLSHRVGVVEISRRIYCAETRGRINGVGPGEATLF